MQLKRSITACVFFVLSWAVAATGFAGIEVDNFEKLSSKRVARTVYEFTYKLNVTNTGGQTLSNVTATVSTTNSGTTIVDSGLSFVDLAAGASASSSDTFVIRHNISMPFETTDLAFDFDYDEGSVETDADGDGVSVEAGDCNDSNASIYPGAPEIANNGIDEDCDGLDLIDESKLDQDNDGYTPEAGDCNDGDASINPGATDIPNNGIDEDCANGDEVDVSLLDQDGDGYTPAAGDCNDNDAGINPGATDIPNNGIDEDCSNGDEVDTSLLDQDGDGYTPAGGDCNDENAAINPGADEIPGNDVDENCDSIIDPGVDPEDKDNDGFSPDQGDCDDSNSAIYPGAESIPNNGIDEDCDGLDPIVGPDYSVRILSPASLVTLGSSPVEISGLVDDTSAVLTVNGVTIEPDDSGNFVASVDLQEGHNSIVARAVKGEQQVTDSISVSLDLTPPYVTIESHQDGQDVFTDTITVTGLINDIVRGTVEGTQASVSVNGRSATISNRSYSAKNIPLIEGENTIQVNGVDQVGNVGTTTITLNYIVPEGRRLELVSGQDQSGIINSELADPLSVKVLNDDLEPVPDTPVVFRVIQGSGAVGVGTESQGRAIVIETDAEGMVSTRFVLGSRSGTDNHKVRAKVVGYDNEIVFTASATGNIGNKLSVNSGNNQRGAVGQLLPEAFVVAVTDDGANVVQGARVKFTVTKGGGALAGVGSTTFDNSYEAVTDSDGRATAEYKLGYLDGIDAQRITATLLDAPTDSEGNVLPISAGFTATAFVPADPGLTSISGVVLDNNDSPIPGVVVRVDGSERQAVTDEEGQFKIEQAPIGPVHLIADGSTATIDGEFPSLSYNIVTISGVDNPLSAPIYMVKLDTDGAVYAGPEDVELTLSAFPGFKLEIAKDSVTFPDGAKEGLVSVTPVNASKVPMAPPNGMQPQFIVTIQPAGTKFDPPARLTLPNVDGHQSGAQVEMYSYDHDLEEFVSIGLGTVSEDTTLITSNSGVGVIKAGWHCGSQPGGSGCCSGGGGGGGCPVCQKSQSNNCSSGNCVPDDSQDPGQCLKCSGGSKVNDDSEDPGECKSCKNGQVEDDPDGTTCDDGKYCTSADGLEPGSDQCEGGKCEGKEIKRRKISEHIVEEDFGKLVEAFRKGLKLTEKISGAKGKPYFTVKGQAKKLNVRECCETEQRMLDNEGVEGSVVVEYGFDFKSPPLIVPTAVGNINIQAVGKVAGRGNGYKQVFMAVCSDPDTCNEKWGGQISGFVEGGLAFSYIHPNLLTVQGTARGGVSGGWTAECGPLKGKACFGPVSLRGQVKALSFVSYTFVWVVPNTSGCTHSQT